MTTTRRTGQTRAQQSMASFCKRCSCVTRAESLPPPTPRVPPPPCHSAIMQTSRDVSASTQFQYAHLASCRPVVYDHYPTVLPNQSDEELVQHSSGAVATRGMDDLPDSALQLTAQHVDFIHRRAVPDTPFPARRSVPELASRHVAALRFICLCGPCTRACCNHLGPPPDCK